MTAATIRVNLEGGNAILKGITMHGTSHSSKQILEYKMEMAYYQHFSEIVMRKIINNMYYTD